MAGPLPFRLRHAAGVIGNGGVIAYPTEAVFGLGADPEDTTAIRRILDLKQRPPDKGLILIAASAADLAPYLAALDGDQWQRLQAPWPGAVTWLAPAAPTAPTLVTGGSGRIAVRVPGHALARSLCAAWGGALVSTSANRAGQPPLRSSVAVRRRFGTRLDDILPGAVGAAQRPTAIHDLVSGTIVRAG